MSTSTSSLPLPLPLPIRTTLLSLPSHTASPVSLTRLSSSFLFALTLSHRPSTSRGAPGVEEEEEEEFEPIWAHLNTLVNADPFPGFSSEGREMIWIKTYSENVGLYEKLQSIGWLRDSGRKIKQGFVEYPLAELRLQESELAHQCSHCSVIETVELAVEDRFKFCSVCRRSYYCSQECQTTDWTHHKVICKLLKAGKFAAVENLNRKKVTEMLDGYGIKTLSTQG